MAENLTLDEPNLPAELGQPLLLDGDQHPVALGTSGDLYFEADGQRWRTGLVARRLADGSELRIDDHGSAMSAQVLALYARVLEQAGPRPTLVEWDTDLPPLAVLLAEVAQAEAVCAAALLPVPASASA